MSERGRSHRFVAPAIGSCREVEAGRRAAGERLGDHRHRRRVVVEGVVAGHAKERLAAAQNLAKHSRDGVAAHGLARQPNARDSRLHGTICIWSDRRGSHRPCPRVARPRPRDDVDGADAIRRPPSRRPSRGDCNEGPLIGVRRQASLCFSGPKPCYFETASHAEAAPRGAIVRRAGRRPARSPPL